MDKPVEFSKFYRVLNAAKEGEEGKSLELESMLKEYEASEKSESALHQLGEIFLYVGIMELYKYSGTQDIKAIGLLDKDDWDGLIGLARNQVKENAHVLDVNVDYVGRDGVRDMKEVVSRLDALTDGRYSGL